MSRIDAGRYWNSVFDERELDLDAIGAPVADEWELEQIWDGRREYLHEFGHGAGAVAVKATLFNPNADPENGTIAFAHGWGTPVESKLSGYEKLLTGARNRSRRVYVLEELYGLDDKRLEAVAKGDFSPYGESYARLFDKFDVQPTISVGHSLGSRAVMAMSVREEVAEFVRGVSLSAPVGARSMSTAEIGLRTVTDMATTWHPKLQRQAEGIQDNPYFSLPFIDMFKSAEQSRAIRHARVIKNGEQLPHENLPPLNEARRQLKIIKGLGAKTLQADIETVLARTNAEVTIWAGRHDLTSPYPHLLGTVSDIKLSDVDNRVHMFASDTRHNSAAARPSKWGDQAFYVAERIG